VLSDPIRPIDIEMTPPWSSDVYIDPDFATLCDTRSNLTRQEPSTLRKDAVSRQPKLVSLPGRKEVHVHFEDSPTEISSHYPTKRQKATSMSSTTSSVYIDPIGLRGPISRPVLNTGVEQHLPSLRSHRSRSSAVSSIGDDDDNSDPWNWPKLLTSSQNRKTRTTAMNSAKDDCHGKALTKRQLGAIRKIVCRPPKHSAGGRRKPVVPDSRRSVVLDIPVLNSNAPSEASDDRNARSAWNYPRLEAHPQKSPSRQNSGKKRESRAQKIESAVDTMPDLFNIQEDLESQHSEREQVPEPAPKTQGKQKGKQKGQAVKATSGATTTA
jgi:hypothetical protein